MHAAGVRRLLIVSVAVLFENQGVASWILRNTMLRNVAEDAGEMERIVIGSDLDWTIVQPPRLTNGPLTGRYRIEDDRMPRGGSSVKLPALVDDDFVLTESVAIVLYLAEKYADGGLLPAKLEPRAEVHRWLLFTATELEQPLWRIPRHTALYPKEKRLPDEVPLARQDFRDMATVMEEHLRGRQSLVGESVTVADLLAAYTLDWANEIHLLEGFPRLRDYMEGMYSRPKAPPRIAAALASVRA